MAVIGNFQASETNNNGSHSPTSTFNFVRGTEGFKSFILRDPGMKNRNGLTLEGSNSQISYCMNYERNGSML
jgi:hypothetical protein